jgi:hypothetical protein
MTTLRATAVAYGVQRPEAQRTEVCMTNLMMQLSETICDERGWFHPHSNETDGLRRRDADRISSFHTPKGTPMKNNTNQQRNAISGWEGEGGAVISDESGTGIVQSEKRAGEQERRDASYQSDVRGEHRYPDAHQTAAEQTARRNRDDLKGRLAGRLAPGSERKLRRK